MAEPLFFALWPDAKVRRALHQLRQGLPRHGGREPHVTDLHITLAYLGRISTGQRDCAEQIAGQVRTPPFCLQVDTLGFWRRSGILWCAPAQTPAPLAELVARLSIGLAECGIVLDRRPFRPHITLVRNARHGTAGAWIEPFAWPVTELVLAAGRQGQRPRYEILARWPLES